MSIDGKSADFGWHMWCIYFKSVKPKKNIFFQMLDNLKPVKS